MGITYFNYNEIILRARRDPAAIVLLTFAQSPLYNYYKSERLMQTLCINHIPSFLFTARTLVLNPVDHRIVCNYKTKKPDSYIRNPEFLTYGINARQKALYLRALSTRRISDKENKIPRDYFGKVADNPFLEVDDDFIYFPLEASN